MTGHPEELPLLGIAFPARFIGGPEHGNRLILIDVPTTIHIQGWEDTLFLVTMYRRQAQTDQDGTTVYRYHQLADVLAVRDDLSDDNFVGFNPTDQEE